eukprot:3769434-Prymnesium_polylepis.1
MLFEHSTSTARFPTRSTHAGHCSYALGAAPPHGAIPRLTRDSNRPLHLRLVGRGRVVVWLCGRVVTWTRPRGRGHVDEVTWSCGREVMWTRSRGGITV